MKRLILLPVMLLSLQFLSASFAEASVISCNISDEVAPYITDADMNGILRSASSTDTIGELCILRIHACENRMPDDEEIVADYFWASLAKGESAEFSAMPTTDPFGSALPMEAIEALFEDRPTFTGPDEESTCNSREYRLRFYTTSSSSAEAYSRVLCYRIDRTLQP